MFLGMALCGNFKSSLVKSHYWKRTMTLKEMIDKDMPIHPRTTFLIYLESSVNLEDLNVRLLPQARKGYAYDPNE